MSASVPSPHPIRLILSLSLSLAVGLGIGRFAYSLVLPDMRDSLGWSYSTAGFMNTMNAAGYLAGALVASRVVRRFGTYQSVWIGMLLSLASLALSAISGDTVIFSIARLGAGVGAAFSLVAGGALAANLAQANPARGSLILSLFYVGPALGVLVSGLVSPFVLQGMGAGSWWMVWVVLFAISAAFALVMQRYRIETPIISRDEIVASIPMRPMRNYLLGYFLFGAGYIAYMTFMVAYVRDAGGDVLAQGALWCAVGLGGMTSPWIWRGVVSRFGRDGLGTAILLVVTMISAAMPMFGHSPWLIGASAFAFGSVFFSVTTATTTFVRLNYPPSAWPQAIAVMTIVFSLGQTLGPIATGALTDALGSLFYALVSSAAALGFAAIAALCQRPLKPWQPPVHPVAGR